MARPIKVGLSYFPLDTSFFSNEKIKTLRRKHGAIGVLTYLNILCKVYGKDGYFFKIPGGDKESFYMDIAEEIASGNDQIRQVTSRVRETIHHLLEQGILDRDLFDKDVISGIALQEQYVLATYKARQKVKIDIYGLVDALEVMRENGVNVAETGVIVTETPVNVAIMTQKKEEEIKEKEIHSFIPRAHDEIPEEEKRKRMGGSLGGGLVFLSDSQMDDLLCKLSLDEFDHYVGVIREAEASGRHYTKKTHYQAILDMADKDRRKGNV